MSFGMCMYTMLAKSRSQSRQRLLFLVVALLLFVFATLDVALLLRHCLDAFVWYHGPGGAVGVIDTVERLQGGERPTVVVSGTVSDPTAVAANAGFVLNLNRANVAFSRVQDRLVVVCSQALLDHIPAEVEHYESAALWKALRDLCSEFVAECEVGGKRVRLYRPPHRTG